MKKILALTLSVFLLMGLAACGNSPAADGSSAASNPASSSNSASEPGSLPEQSSSASLESEPEELPSSSSAEGEVSSSAPSEAAQEGETQSSEPAAEEQPDEGTSAALVAYFSWSGNTRTVAEKIQAQTGADLFEIATVNGYSDDYDTVLDEAQAEQSANARPELNGHVENMADYQVIYLGYPNWWGDMPMALYSFLDEYDLSGKTIVPFVTSGGSGFSGTIQSIQGTEPNAAVTEGLSISGSSASNSDAQITEWLNGLGLTE